MNTTHLAGEEMGGLMWSVGAQGHFRAVKLE